MASTPRPKSPRTPNSAKNENESFWDKIGTLGRKKRIKEGMKIVLTKCHTKTYKSKNG